jgi:hypothetical protein
MADARDRAEWHRTAWLLCHVLNMASSEDSKPITPEDCNPYALRERRLSGEEDERNKPLVIPYNPAILIAMQERHKQLQNPEPPKDHG